MKDAYRAHPSTWKTACINAWKTHHIRLHVQYSLPDVEHKMFETSRRQEELNQSINLKSAFCWLTLHNCITIHGTKKHKIVQAN